MEFFLRLFPARELLTIRNIRSLLLSRLCANLYFYSTTIVIFQRQRGLDFAAMFAMESILSLAIILADIPTSIWADRYGYKRIILMGRLCSITGMLCFLLAHGFWLFALSNVLGGFAIACNSGCEGALLYQSLTRRQREQHGDAAFTLLRQASTCGLFLGLISGSFIGALSPDLAVGMSLAPLLCSLVAAFYIEEKKRSATSLPQHVSRRVAEIVQVALRTFHHEPELVGLSILNSAAFAFINAIFWFNQPYFIRAGIAVAWFGPLTAIAMVGQFLALSRLPTLQRYLGTRLLLILSCLLPGVAYILLARTDNSYVTVVLIGCVIALSAWREPLVNNQLHKGIKDEARATTLSALSLFGSFTGIALNPFIGSLGDHGLTTVGFGLGAGLLVLCILMLTVFRKRDYVSRET